MQQPPYGGGGYPMPGASSSHAPRPPPDGAHSQPVQDNGSGPAGYPASRPSYGYPQQQQQQNGSTPIAHAQPYPQTQGHLQSLPSAPAPAMPPLPTTTGSKPYPHPHAYGSPPNRQAPVVTGAQQFIPQPNLPSHPVPTQTQAQRPVPPAVPAPPGAAAIAAPHSSPSMMRPVGYAQASTAAAYPSAVPAQAPQQQQAAQLSQYPQPAQQQQYPPQQPQQSNATARPMAAHSMLPPTGIEKLTHQMQSLSTATASPASASAGQPVGIIGQTLPIDSIQQDASPSPIQPYLDPAYVRLTLNKVPRTSAILYKTRLPFGITVCPYPSTVDDAQVPVIDGPIVRCRRCRTYLNPYVQIVDQGLKWKCNLCFLDNEFPANYDYDPATQRYVDRSSKAELASPVYDFIAPMEYMVRPPQPPVYLFLLDVSYNAVASGLCATATRIIASVLDGIPNAQGRSKVGLMTVDSTMHFYQMPSASASAAGGADAGSNEIKMLVVADLEDPFLPSAHDLLVDVGEGRASVERALQKIPTLFAGTQNTASALGPALTAATKLLAPIGGKIVVIQASLPSVGEGKLANRDDPKVYGTSKENALLQPATSFYKSMATECQRVHVCVDLFLFPSTANAGASKQHLDVATIGCVARFTGGHLFWYEDWDVQSVEAVEKFAADMTGLVQTEIGLEAVVRIRASQGVTLSAYHGSFFLRSADLLSLPNVNRRHAYSAQISIEENITSQLACFQTAVLHTTCQGERRIRVLNAAFPVTDDAREVFAHADVGSMADLLLKMAAEKVLSNRLEDARDALTNKMVDILGAVKTTYQTGQNPQLLLPEALKLLPLLMLSILKSPTLRGGALTRPDLRSYYLALVKTLPVADSLSWLHPYLFALHAMPNQCGLPDERGEIVMPPALQLGSEVLERHGLYVLYNAQDVFIWVGSQVHPELCQLVFGQPLASVPAGRLTLPMLDNPWCRRLANILEVLRRRHASHPSTYVIREDGQPLAKSLFLQHLIEDKGMDGQPSYSAWASTLRDKIYSTSR